MIGIYDIFSYPVNKWQLLIANVQSWMQSGERNFYLKVNYMNTIFSKECDVKNDWYVIDAAGKTLGRVAAVAASVLRGKNKPTYTPNSICGDFVVIINADKIQVTGNKADDKLYRHYTGFVRGLRSYSFNELIAKHPAEPLKRTIWGMLPHNRLGRKIIGNLKIYAGADHPHAAQNPQPLEV